MEREKVQIVPYNPQWPQQFLKIQEILASELNSIAVSIDHIGSTSVPGLGSKDRIDVQITVSKIDEATKAYIDTGLKALGFPNSTYSVDHVPFGGERDETHWKKLYVRGYHPHLSFHTNIHIRAATKSNQRYALLFRDYLRSHPDSAKAYERFKQKAAEHLSDDRDTYADLKDPVCDLIMTEAEKWASTTGWGLGSR